MISQFRVPSANEINLIKNNTNGILAANTDFTNFISESIPYYLTKQSETSFDTKYYVTLGADGYRSFNVKSDDPAGLKPLIHYFSIKNKCSNHRVINGVTYADYGEFPQSIVSKEEMKKMEEYYKKSNLLTTGKVYYFPQVEITHYNEYRKPIEYTINKSMQEFYYNNNKYVRVAIAPKDNPADAKIAYFKVEPITFVIDEKDNLAISRDVLVYGISYKKSKDYLTNFFKEDIIPSKVIKMQNNVVYDKTYMNNQVQDLVEQIKAELSNYYGDEDILLIVKNLIDEYNNNINDSNKNGLTTKQNDKKILYLNLVGELEKILSNLKVISIKYSKYTEMLNLISEWNYILDTKLEDFNFDNSISNDIVKIKNIILPYLNDNESLVKLKKIINDEENKIKSFISNNNLNGYKDLQDFEFNFRTKLQDYLLNINKKVNDKDVVNEVKDAYKSMLNNKTFDIKNNYIKFYLEEMQKVYNFVKESGNVNDVEKLNEILNKPIDYNNNLPTILNELNIRYSQIYRIKLDIEENLNNLKESNEYTIDINI